MDTLITKAEVSSVSFVYDAVIVGGGMAGLQASIQLGRYRRQVMVIDAGDGRSALCRMYRNVLGFPDGISGETLRKSGQAQAETYGIQFVRGRAERAERNSDGTFRVSFQVLGGTGRDAEVVSSALLLATGVKDRLPPLPSLLPCLGLSVFVCPDCDGYETAGKRTLVLGSGNTGARMVKALQYFTDELIYVNHEREPMDQELHDSLHAAGVDVVQGAIREVLTAGDPSEGRFAGVLLEGGARIEGERGFIAFGGNEVRSWLAEQLGAERHENGHIMTDARTKMTTVPNLWAAGDIGVHSEQVTIAMGEGCQAAIWMHKTLLRLRQ